jgi:hypothetical protein
MSPRPALRAITVALVALAIAAPAAPADTNPIVPCGTSVNPCQNPFGGTPGHARTPADVTAAAKAQERYYSSYGDPEPLTPAASPTGIDADDGIAPLPFVLALLAALTVGMVAGSALQRLRRRGAPRPA